MSSDITRLKPALLWKHFAEICKVPHCSREEEKLAAYVTSAAKAKGYDYKTDDSGNVVIKVPATEGYENAPTIVLQGHLDMVCEKNSDVKFDFACDSIDAYVDGEWVTAKGTTLGADNGIGMAAGLAVMDDEECIHGPLELLFTTDEETGLNGAQGLQPGFLEGKILLNLDSEEEGAFSIGCAGGGDSEILLPVSREKSSGGSGFKVMLSGLRGGHSGIDIHTGRGNAAQLLARMLYQLEPSVQLVDIEGGSKHNAIPREAWACILSNASRSDLEAALQKRFDEIAFEFKAVEKEIKFTVEPFDVSWDPLTVESQDKLLALIVAIPYGVYAMSQEIPGLVETSNNLAIVKTLEKEASVYTSTRSSILSALEALRKKIESVGNLAEGKTEHLIGYPAWTPNLDSSILKTMQAIYKEVAGKEAKVEAIHAGLECGIIGEKYPGMDMISFGPDLENPHSPDERVHIESVGRFYQLVTKTLESLAK